jgi:uracil-DNA glycosylase
MSTTPPSEAEASPKPQLPPDWLAALEGEFAQPYMSDLKAFLLKERAEHPVYPPGRDMFSAFWHTPLAQARVVILGQDPYHGPDQANGLCFSVRKGVPTPPSLRNMFRELNESLQVPVPKHGDLTAWADQGVLLLNTVLSVRAHQANSHRGQGWERFTDQVIRVLNSQREGLVFLLWGAPAGKKAAMLDGQRHLVLKAPHPSPLSAHSGFFGCGHFARTNEHLVARGEAPINWRLPD